MIDRQVGLPIPILVADDGDISIRGITGAPIGGLFHPIAAAFDPPLPGCALPDSDVGSPISVIIGRSRSAFTPPFHDHLTIAAVFDQPLSARAPEDGQVILPVSVVITRNKLSEAGSYSAFHCAVSASPVLLLTINQSFPSSLQMMKSLRPSPS
jgi:hypothetical protein